ncbi:MAG: hypothetical protein EZS28_049411, partial [Streblomastix strix]
TVFKHERPNSTYIYFYVASSSSIDEANMHFGKEQRTLHFFTKGLWQPIYFVGLPDKNSITYIIVLI